MKEYREFTAEVYDKMMRNLRDRGWIETDLILKTRINHDLSLEIGLAPDTWVSNGSKRPKELLSELLRSVPT